MPIKADWIEFSKETISLIHPKDTGVYECGYRKGNRVVYIGKGLLRSRLLKHTEEVKFLGVTHFRKRKTEDADDAERRLMDNFCKVHNGSRPKLNIQKPTMKNSSRQPYVPLDKIKTLL